jgi:branched-chain amino acid transport system ATP-binding protein
VRQNILETSNLSVRFGSVTALDIEELHVAEGETVGLIGANGAGKSTWIDAGTGFVESTGTVRLAAVRSRPSRRTSEFVPVLPGRSRR